MVSNRTEMKNDEWRMKNYFAAAAW